MAHEMSPDDPAFRLACQDLVELLTDYLEGALDAAAAADVADHLAACEPCRTYLDQLRETVACIGRAGAVVQLSEQSRADVLAAFRDLRPPH